MSSYKLEYSTVAGAIAIALVNRFLQGYLVWTQGIAYGCILLACLVYFHEVDVRISSGGRYRSGATAGSWCSLLIPLILVTLFQDSHKFVALSSIVLLVTSIVLLQAIVKPLGGDSWKWVSLSAQVLIVSILGGYGIHNFTYAGLQLSIFTNLILGFLFLGTISAILRAWPGSFTAGEAIIWGQAISLFTVFASIELYATVNSTIPLTESQQITIFTSVALLGCELAVALWMSTQALREPIGFYAVGACVAAAFILPGMMWGLNKNPFYWFYNFMTEYTNRLYLLWLWLFFTAAAVLVVVVQQYTNSQASTIVRKGFHLITVLVFASGLCMDSELLRLATLMCFGIFVVLEAIRYLKVPPFGSFLSDKFSVFLDEKDSGPLVLTPMYLLIGCSIPLWLVSHLPTGALTGVTLAKVCGLLFVGIGDSAAAIGGSLIGRHNWPDSRRTVEGTVCAILAQLIALYSFAEFGCIPHYYHPTSLLINVILGVVVTSFMEAFTSQVDNIVVPLLSLFIYLNV